MLLKLSAENMARLCARRPWATISIWLLALIISFVAIATFLGTSLTTEESFLGNPDSEIADTLLEERLRGTEPFKEMVIITSPSLTVDDPRFRQKAEQVYGDAMGMGTGAVETGFSYYQTSNESLVSRDRHTTIMPLVMTGDEDEVMGNIPVLHAIVSQHDDGGEIDVLTAGPASVGKDFQDIASEDMQKAEFYGIIPALAVLVLVFGSLAAAVVPLGLAIFSIIMAVGIAALVGHYSSMTFFVVNMITMMGLAVGIDYSLFVLSRYREERAHGAEKLTAITTAGATAGRAVAFSGMTVILALVGLLVVPTTIFRSLGAGAIFVVAISVMAALTLLPAIIGIMGDRVNSLRLPFIQKHTAEAYSDRNGFWGHSVRLVMRHPVISIILTTGALVAAALLYLDINTGSATGVATLPDGIRSKKGFEVLERDFSYGMLLPMEIVIDGRMDSPGVQEGIGRLRERLQQDLGLSQMTFEVNREGDLGLLSVVVSGDPNEDSAINVVRELRARVIPEAFAGVDAGVYVTGMAAQNLDYFNITDDYRPIVFALVLGLSFILLTIVFHSIVVPVKAMIMNLLSVGAAYGLMVLVFQKGYGAALLGFQKIDAIEAWVPLMLFTVLFGLSMDYHVFLLSRIRERYILTGDNRDSVAFGVQSTGRIITGAALIMVAVFAGFASGNLIMFQQVGFGLAVAVLIDATIIRTVLVPAAMQLLGKANWYLPRCLKWLPDFHVEGARHVSISRDNGDKA